MDLFDFAPPRAAPPPTRSSLVDFKTIYLEPEVRGYPCGREVLARYPGARLVEIASHIHAQSRMAAEEVDWLDAKRDLLVLGVKKTQTVRPNGRSADFIAPSTSSGCALACLYCYVARRKLSGNPITVFVNTEDTIRSLQRHIARQGIKPEPNQVDPVSWVYDLGENSDLSVDAMISSTVEDLVAAFRRLPTAKASFATKFVSPVLLSYNPQGRTRVRMSLMPREQAKVLDVRTSPIPRRIAFMNELRRAGYEVHVNFSPVVVRDGWLAEWAQLFEEVDEALEPAVKKQLAAEIIFLTHNAELHEVNEAWHPKGEALLWRPDLQEDKISESGQPNLRYKAYAKRGYLDALQGLLAQKMPYCRVRYAF